MVRCVSPIQDLRPFRIWVRMYHLTRDVQWSTGVAWPCFVLVRWNLTPVSLRPSNGEEKSSLELTSPLEPWRSTAVPLSISTFPCGEGCQDTFWWCRKAAVLEWVRWDLGLYCQWQGLMFLDNHDTQCEEAQITNKNGDFYQLANLSLLTNVTELVADPSNLAPSVVHDTATALFARLPPQHRRPKSGRGGGGSCLSGHRAQCAGAETELCLSTLWPHLLSGWHQNKKLRVVTVCGMVSARFFGRAGEVHSVLSARVTLRKTIRTTFIPPTGEQLSVARAGGGRFAK